MNTDLADGGSLGWVRSSYTENVGGKCVEVARAAASIRVRDSKDSGGCQLRLGPAAWWAFAGFAAARD